MKRTLTLLTLLILALSLSGAVGCGDKETVVDNATSEGGTAAEDSDNGEATDKGGSMTFNDGSGGNTAGGGGGIVTPEAVMEAPDEAELGVPAYPGATLDPDNSATINAGNQPVPADVTIASYTTSDSLAQVTDFYRGKLGEPMASTANSADWWQGDMASGSYTVVHIELKSGKVNINIVGSTAAAK